MQSQTLPWTPVLQPRWAWGVVAMLLRFSWARHERCSLRPCLTQYKRKTRRTSCTTIFCWCIAHRTSRWEQMRLTPSEWRWHEHCVIDFGTSMGTTKYSAHGQCHYLPLSEASATTIFRSCPNIGGTICQGRNCTPLPVPCTPPCKPVCGKRKVGLNWSKYRLRGTMSMSTQATSYHQIP